MVCDCCGRKKKLFESFAAIKLKNIQLNFCVECNDLAYKVRDFANEINKDEYEKALSKWNKRTKKSSDSFREWQKEFLKPLEEKINKKNEN